MGDDEESIAKRRNIGFKDPICCGDERQHISNRNEPTLEISNIWHRRDNKEILRGINLSSTANRIGIVGCNGSGKSSFARLLVGLEAPSSGTLRIFGADVANDRAFALKNVGIIFQNPDQQIIFPTVGEEICFGLENLGLDKTRRLRKAQSIMDRFGVGDWADNPVHTLSHGQKHLVCLMSVLAMEPKLIILDEPYTSLDIPTAARMRRLLYGLSQHIALISHNPADFEGFEEIIWLEDGELRAHGACDNILPKFVDEMEQQARSC